MALPVIFTPALDCLRTWDSEPFFWMAHTAATATPDVGSVTELLTACPELTVTGYARLPVDTPERAYVPGELYLYYLQGPEVVAFTGLAAGEVAQAVTLVKDDGDDDTSLPVCQWALGSVPTSAGTVTLNLQTRTVMKTRQGYEA